MFVDIADEQCKDPKQLKKGRVTPDISIPRYQGDVGKGRR